MTHPFPIFRKGINWAHIGGNIGPEEDKHRPVLVIRSERKSPICAVIPLTTKRLGPGPNWSWMIDELGWVKEIDELVRVVPGDCRLSVGQRVNALLVNILTDPEGPVADLARMTKRQRAAVRLRPIELSKIDFG